MHQPHAVVVSHPPPLALGRSGRTEARDRSAHPPPERRILRLVADGLTSREIAGQLAIGVRTVEHHRNNVAVKLALRGSHALTKFALKHKSDL